jgi:hypothetical protein
VVLQLTVFWYSGAVLGHVCLGLGVLASGPCCSIGFSFSPNGALEFVLFCGRLAVSQYTFLFIHSPFFDSLLQGMSGSGPGRAVCRTQGPPAQSLNRPPVLDNPSRSPGPQPPPCG